jgi:hypothetical protein
MKTIYYYFLFILFLVSSSNSFAKGFQPPSKGKAVVYFTRVTKYAAVTSFEYFHKDKYIGVFKGQNYMRYECDPGQNLFWVSTENKEFITADLKEGESYIVIVDVTMGVMKARVGLTPITEKDIEFERAKEIILSKDPIITPEEKIAKMNVQLTDFINEKLTLYETEWKLTNNFKHISPEMAIPASAMN